MKKRKFKMPKFKKICPKHIELLMIHHSDTVVKPIIGNKEIEAIEEVTYRKDLLSFEPLTAEEFSKRIERPESEALLSQIYNGIVNNSSVEKIINSLAYFESIIVNSRVANRLINSAFLVLFTHMLKSMKSPKVKIRVCSIVGLLIRHATVIDNEVAKSGIAQLLVLTMKDLNERVKRKTIASLGEYLFYAATQLDDD